MIGKVILCVDKWTPHDLLRYIKNIPTLRGDQLTSMVNSIVKMLGPLEAGPTDKRCKLDSEDLTSAIVSTFEVRCKMEPKSNRVTDMFRPLFTAATLCLLGVHSNLSSYSKLVLKKMLRLCSPPEAADLTTLVTTVYYQPNVVKLRNVAKEIVRHI